MSKRMKVLGRINEMALPTVRELIGLSAWHRIQDMDSAPTFVEMTIAHEGTSRGEIVGWGARLKQWSKQIIRSVVEAFAPAGKSPVLIYDGIEHWHGNEAQRVPVGEVVHSFGDQVEGIEEARCIGWIYPQFNGIATERDCCSLELEALMIEHEGRTVVEKIYNAVGVVLGHTSKQTPGFAGARVQAITEFGPVEAGPSENAGESTGQQGQSNPPAAAAAAPTAAPFTKSDLISAIREAGIQPGDIWPAPVVPAPLPEAVVTPAEKPAVPVVDPLSTGNPFLPE